MPTAEELLEFYLGSMKREADVIADCDETGKPYNTCPRRMQYLKPVINIYNNLPPDHRFRKQFPSACLDFEYIEKAWNAQWKTAIPAQPSAAP
ncbi:MAG: hypothetical protein ABIG30_00890 [Candidatus Aenigmatarchaeota archaeon]